MSGNSSRKKARREGKKEDAIDLRFYFPSILSTGSELPGSSTDHNLQYPDARAIVHDEGDNETKSPDYEPQNDENVALFSSYARFGEHFASINSNDSASFNTELSIDCDSLESEKANFKLLDSSQRYGQGSEVGDVDDHRKETLHGNQESDESDDTLSISRAEKNLDKPKISGVGGLDEASFNLDRCSIQNEQEQENELKCPICDVYIAQMAPESRNVHVNHCIDASSNRNKDSCNDNGMIYGCGNEVKTVSHSSADRETLGYRERVQGFEKILQHNKEEAIWCQTTKEQASQRGKLPSYRTCPFYKIMPFGIPFSVDAFKYGSIDGCKGYFLSHFHSDHYGGLHGSWKNVVHLLKVSPEFVEALPLNQEVYIEGVFVTLIDANHCPGSVIFLFEKTSGSRPYKVLHCGDFRACPSHINHPSVKNKVLDAVFLDTTYLNTKYAFPSQDDVISACALAVKELTNENESPLIAQQNFRNKNLSRFALHGQILAKTQNRSRLLVVVGTYSIGKEKLVLACAKALNTKIYANKYKRKMLKCLDDDGIMQYLTESPETAQVHMTSLQEIRTETLSEYLQEYSAHFDRIVGFRGTGWTFRPPKGRQLDSPSIATVLNSWKVKYTVNDLIPARGSTQRIKCFGIPYSEHSSFRDLTLFCLSLPIRRIIPTVNIQNARSRTRMRSWIEKWEKEKERNGLLKNYQW